MTLQSSYKALGPVTLPEYQGRQMYMHTFNPQDPHMPAGYEDYLEPVMALLDAAGIEATAVHMTVDEKVVQPGMSQRRPGAHVDGCYLPDQTSMGRPPLSGMGALLQQPAGPEDVRDRRRQRPRLHRI